MLRSGKCYHPEVAELLKAWKEEREEEKRRHAQEQAEDRARYEELITGLAESRPRRVEVEPESLKLTKLTDNDNIKAFLTTLREQLRLME